MGDAPKLFRVILQVADLNKAITFYSKLLDTKGRPLRGSRAYFDCGPVILAILDRTPGGVKPKSNRDNIYFSVKDIEKAHQRARELGCVSTEIFHDASTGEVVTRC